MLITVTLEPEQGSGIDATDLGFLLRKHPAKLQRFSSSVGDIQVFYPHAAPDRCTAAMLLEVDPVGIVRNRRFRGDAGAIDHYVNDRPYAASSMLAVAIGTVFRTAMNGESSSHPELAQRRLPLRIEIPAVSTRGEDRHLIRRVFEPCGWSVDESPLPLDPEHPEWGDSRLSSLVLTGRVRLAHALRQLYVLLPVLDEAKHYWVGDDEVTKLERNGEGWLADHPERALIARRYLLHQRTLLGPSESAEAEEQSTGAARAPLRTLRAEAVIGAVRDCGAHRIVDMGCGQGALLRRLAKDRAFTEIVGVDVSVRALEQARRSLHLDDASDAQRERVRLLHGSVVYRDSRLSGFDAVVLMEVIEHVETHRLGALEDTVFAGAAPSAVIVTTPNAEYNARYPELRSGGMRHSDHRFEWTREQFRSWANGVCSRRGYAVEFRSVGDEDSELGPPTQLALFRKEPA